MKVWVAYQYKEVRHEWDESDVTVLGVFFSLASTEELVQSSTKSGYVISLQEMVVQP